MATCANCHSAKVRPTTTLCSACYEYDRCNGRARPEAVVIKHNVRRHEQEAARRRR